MLCDRTSTARYIFIVAKTNNDENSKINELKVFSEKEIGRTITNIDYNGSVRTTGNVIPADAILGVV